MKVETDEAFLKRITKVRYVPVLERLIAMARRPSRNDVLEEAAKECDAKREEYEESSTVEWQASNDEYSLRMGDKADVCVELAAAIRALKEPT